MASIFIAVGFLIENEFTLILLGILAFTCFGLSLFMQKQEFRIEILNSDLEESKFQLIISWLDQISRQLGKRSVKK